MIANPTALSKILTANTWEMGKLITVAVKATIASLIPKAPGVMLIKEPKVEIIDRNKIFNKPTFIPNILNSKSIIKTIITTLIIVIKVVANSTFLFDFTKCQPLITSMHLFIKEYLVFLISGEKTMIASKNKKSPKKKTNIKALKIP